MRVDATCWRAKRREEVAGCVFNVATGRRVDLNETFQILKKLTGYPGSVSYGRSVLGT